MKHGVIQAQVYYRNSNTSIFSQFCLNERLKKFLRQVLSFWYNTGRVLGYGMLRVAVPNKGKVGTMAHRVRVRLRRYGYG